MMADADGQQDSSGKVEELHSSFTMRWFYRYEVEHLLVRADLELEALYGNFDRSPLGDSSPEMIFVARSHG